jgi:hypothetical protein
MAQRPGMLGRMAARLAGEVPSAVLEGFQRAGSEVYGLLDELEQRRLEWKVKDLDAWSVEPGAQIALVCAWNAFALQLLGDRLLEADYQASPRTVGYVPPVTAEQALAFYGQVAGWLGRARQAEASTTYELDVDVPAPLPPWSEVVPCPSAHLAAMRAALDQLHQHASAALVDFHLDPTDEERRRAQDRIHELLATAESSAGYADRLWAPTVPPALHEEIERHAKTAVEAFYELGQLLAMPRLATRPRPNVSPAARSVRRPGPGEPAFDPWCLTDPGTRASWQQDPDAREAIAALWASDPDPDRTLGIQAAIDAAATQGDIVASSPGHYYCCPWAPIYEVRRPVTIAGRDLRPIQQFTFDVSAEEMADGKPFKRELVVAQFHPTDRVDYCIPGREHDD